MKFNNIFLSISLFFFISIFSTKVFSIEREAFSKDAIIKGFVQYQASRIEKVLLNSMFDRVRYRYSFQVLFPQTSQALQDYEGIAGSRLIPLMKVFIQKDIDNFDQFAQCIVLQMVESRDYKKLRNDILNHFTKKNINQDNTDSKYHQSVDAYIKTNGTACNKPFDIEIVKKSLDDLKYQMHGVGYKYIESLLSSLMDDWMNELMQNVDFMAAMQASQKYKSLIINNAQAIRYKKGSYYKFVKSCNLIIAIKGKVVPGCAEHKDFIAFIKDNVSESLSESSRVKELNDLIDHVSSKTKLDFASLYQKIRNAEHTKKYLESFEYIKGSEYAVVSSLFSAWIREIKNNKRIDLKAFIKRHQSNDSVKALEKILVEDVEYLAHLKTKLPGNDTYFKEILQVHGQFKDDIIKAIKDDSVIDEDYFSDIKDLLDLKYSEGLKAIEKLIANDVYSSSYKLCKESEEIKKYDVCKLVDLVFEYDSFISDINENSNVVKFHYFMKIVNKFRIVEQFERDGSEFTNLALFLAELMDTASSSGDDDTTAKSADRVASVIDSFVNEEQVFIDKRKHKTCLGRGCQRNSLFISSYFGFNGLQQKSDFDMEDTSRPFGPVGIEYKIWANGYGSWGINYSMIDIGGAILNELNSDSSAVDNYSSLGTKSLFFTYTFKKAPISILAGQYINLNDNNGIEDKVSFIGLAFDLPLFKLY